MALVEYTSLSKNYKVIPWRQHFAGGSASQQPSLIPSSLLSQNTEHLQLRIDIINF
jgi:hypothetical protein